MDKNKIDMALYVIDLKIVELMKSNTAKNYAELDEKIAELKAEKEEIYNNNEEVINEVLDKYLKDVKN